MCRYYEGVHAVQASQTSLKRFAVQDPKLTAEPWHWHCGLLVTPQRTSALLCCCYETLRRSPAQPLVTLPIQVRTVQALWPIWCTSRAPWRSFTQVSSHAACVPSSPLRLASRQYSCLDECTACCSMTSRQLPVARVVPARQKRTAAGHDASSGSRTSC